MPGQTRRLEDYKQRKEPIRLETNMMDQIMLVFGTGPVETWEVLRVWHTSEREEAGRKAEVIL
mgnify:CR=1 FL=1